MVGNWSPVNCFDHYFFDIGKKKGAVPTEPRHNHGIESDTMKYPYYTTPDSGGSDGNPLKGKINTQSR